jgi:protein-tyrosine-phosphatase
VSRLPEHRAQARATTSVLFVCLGNICRSPMAKWVFTHRAESRGVRHRLTIDSCGTGHWHVGGPADHRAVATAAGHGLSTPHVARQLDPTRDFASFDLLVAMDRSNLSTLEHRGAPRDRLVLMRHFDPELPHAERHQAEVPDPYEGDQRDFEAVYWMLVRSADGLLDHLFGEGGAGTPVNPQTQRGKVG